MTGRKCQVFLTVSMLMTASALAESPVAEVQITDESIAVRPYHDSGNLLFTISGPSGFRIEKSFRSSASFTVPLASSDQPTLPDGDYTYEIRVKSARKDPPSEPLIQSEIFRVRGGDVVRLAEERSEALPMGYAALPPEVVFTENIIARSICSSSDAGCVDGEALGIIDLKMKGNIPLIRWERTGAGDKSWDVDVDLGGFRIAQITDGRAPLLIDDNAPSNSLRVDSLGRVGLGTSTPATRLHVAGTARIDGDVTLGSSRLVKQDLVAADVDAVLERLVQLPIYTWSYVDDPARRHTGPVAEEFGAAFGPDPAAAQISVVDVSGVALAAIQALHAQQQELLERIAVLEERLAEKEREALQAEMQLAASKNGAVGQE